jgi:3-phenylpropionate/trans-cinnamate dioxygenase ferredoxin reductase subunit
MNDRYDVVIVGAGHAGVNLAAYLTKGGFAGSVALLSDEETLPYKRPPLSKGFLLGTEPASNLLLRTDEYWAKSPVHLLRGTAVREVNSEKQCVVSAQGREIGYGHLVWAAGGRARSLPLPGGDFKGVHHVRTWDDVVALKDELPSARRAVVIGGGYIGLETAAAFRKLGIEVTAVEAAQRILARVTSPVVSQHFHQVHKAAGVDIRVGRTVKGILGDGGRVSSVLLDDGEQLAADIAIVGVGMEPNCEVLATAGAVCSNGVEVDEFCRTSLPAVSAVGDCTSQLSPLDPGRRIRLESVQNANEQAKVVASVLLGTPAVSTEVPWFWSDQYDVKFKSAGLITTHDRLIVRGDPDAGAFTVVYLCDGEVVAIDAINSQAEFAQGRALVKQRARLDEHALADHERSLKAAMFSGSCA